MITRKRAGVQAALTMAQVALLRQLAASEDGCDSYCYYLPAGAQTVKKADVRTVVSLVARGLLAGRGGRIRVTPAAFVAVSAIDAATAARAE